MKDSHGIAEVEVQTADCLLCYVFQSRFFVHTPFFAKQFTDNLFNALVVVVVKLECVCRSFHFHSKDIITLLGVYPFK